MPAGLVVIPILDADGTPRNFNFWSDDGTDTGNLSPAPLPGLNVNGQSDMAGSTPVVVASNQSPIDVDIQNVNANGQAIMDDSTPVVIASNQSAVSIKVEQADYETVAASQTDQVLGATGASGDYLGGLLIVPATTSPGAVTIKDGSGSAITVFTGGADSVSNLVPFFVTLGIKSTGGAWKVTTGADVSAIGVGDFT